MTLAARVGHLEDLLADALLEARSLRKDLSEGASARKPPLVKLIPERGQEAREEYNLPQLEAGDYRRTKPRIVTCRESPSTVKTWKDVMITVVNWLIDEGLLDDDQPKDMKYPFVSTDKSKLSQNHAKYPETYIEEVHGGFFLDTWGNVSTKAGRLSTLCHLSRVNPEDVTVALKFLE